MSATESKFTFTDAVQHSWTDGVIEEGKHIIPKEIAQTEQWIVYEKKWNNEKSKYDKKPRATEVSDSKFGGKWVKSAGVQSPDQFLDWRGAYDFVEETNRNDNISNSLDGCGFVFTAEDDFIGIDLDDCVDEDGHIKQFVNKFLGSIDSFAEFSQSGEGIHIIAKGTVDPDYKQRDDDLGIEIYDENRYFAITGNQIKGKSDSVKDATETIHQLQHEFLDKREVSKDDEMADFDTLEPDEDTPDDDVVIQTAINCSDEFERLHNGGGPSDTSRGDLAYVNKLSFYCQSRERQMIRIWKNSGRARDKLNRDDYVQDTVQTALASNTDDWEGAYHR